MRNSLSRFFATVPTFVAAFLITTPISSAHAQIDSSNGLKTPLVTFGKSAKKAEGDHDFRQIVHFSVPEGTGTLDLYIFDPDVGDSYDEPQKGFNSRTRFSLFGAGSEAVLMRDKHGILQEEVSGTAIVSSEFGANPRLDGTWVKLSHFSGELGEKLNNKREFFLLVEGIRGNDGNVFDVSVTSGGQPVEGIRYYSYLPTFQLPEDSNTFIELRFDVPSDAEALLIENFDSAGATITYDGRFRTKRLKASRRSKWEMDRIALGEGEIGVLGSVTARSGDESPNDMTLFVETIAKGSDDQARKPRPLAIELPVRHFVVRPRPKVSVDITPLACNQMRFAISAKPGSDGDDLTIRWRTEPGMDWVNQPILEKTFAAPGLYTSRVEVPHGGANIGNSVALDKAFLVKALPNAAIEARAIVSEDENAAGTMFDGRSSTASALPEGNVISRYDWDFGDGVTLTQLPGDPDFGAPSHIYGKPGTYLVKLSVQDQPDHPCNLARAEHTIVINGTPIADAGEDRRSVPGQELVFDGGPIQGADGDKHYFQWSFGDGTTATGNLVSHSFVESGLYTITLSVDDHKGAQNSLVTDTATVFVNASPDGSDVIIPQNLVIGDVGRFDARGAIDPDGSIAKTRWTIGDGTNTSEPSFQHSFEKAGTYHVQLLLDDGSGLANAETLIERDIIVAEITNEAPIANAGGDRDTIVGKELVFDASQSFDPDGSILSFHWSFGDGKTASGIGVKHTFREAGTYHAELTIGDDANKPNSVTILPFDIVVAKKPNLSPRIEVYANRTSFVNEIVTFDSSYSSDPDGNILSIDWDFGDGNSTQGTHATHAYTKPGVFTVKIGINDDSKRVGELSEQSFEVAVSHAPNIPPVQIGFVENFSIETEIKRLFDASSARDIDGDIISYMWHFGDGTSSNNPVTEHSYAVPGTYRGRLVLVDSSGLPSGKTTLEFTATVTELLNYGPAAIAGPDKKIIVGQSLEMDGSASFDPDGSIIRYDWDFGNGKVATGQKRSIAYFEPGKYQVSLTVTDNSGESNESATDSLTITVTDALNIAPVAAVLSDKPAAIDEPIEFSGAASSDADGNILNYDWDFGDGTTGAGREIVHSYTKSGTYITTLSMLDDSGLANGASQITRTLTINEPPVANAGIDQHVTASQVMFDASGSVDDDGEIISYDWDFGDGETGKGRRIIHTYRSTGTYKVDLKIVDSSGTIRNGDDDDLSVRINAIPVADAGFDRVVKPGEEITFDGRRSVDPDGSITSYHWDFRDGAQANGDVVTHAYDKPGIYTVELNVQDDSGHAQASDFSQIRIEVNDQPVAIAGADIAVAPGEVFTLSSLASFDRDGDITATRWDIQGANPILNDPDITQSIEKPGVYVVTLTVTDNSTASNRTAQDDLVIHVNQTPVAEAGSNQFSGDLRIVLDAGASADPDGDGLTYSWNLGDGNTAQGAVVEHTYETGGIYPVLLTINDGRGLANSKDTDALTITLNRLPMAAAGDDRQVCVGDIVVFDASRSDDPDNGLLSYKWAFGDGVTSQLINPTKTYLNAGIYSVSLKVTDESGQHNASHIDEALVNVLPAPIAHAGDDIEICAGSTVFFDGTNSTDVDGVVNRYSWDFGDGQAGGGDRPAHIYDEPGSYRASLQIEGDNLGLCSPISTDDLIISVLDAPVSVISAPKSVAVGDEVIFDGANSFVRTGTVSSYEWQIEGQPARAGQQTVHVFDRPGTYRVELQVAAGDDIGGCASAVAVHTLIVNAAPLAVAGDDRIAEIYQPVSFSAAASSDPDGGIATYHWDFGDGSEAAGIEASHIWKTAGRYEISLSVDDGAGLSNSVSTDTISIEIQDAPLVRIDAAKRACPGQPIAFQLANLPPDAQRITWSFGDGSSASENTPSHSYKQPGEYTAGVTFVGKRGGSDLDTPLASKIIINKSPIATIDAVRNACVGQAVEFDGSKSYDSDGDIVDYEWNFDDGTTVKGEQASHTFSQPGTYLVRLNTTDSSGTDCATTEQVLRFFVNAAPIANAGDDISMLIGGAADSLILDASASSDPNNDPLDHYWVLSNGIEIEGEKVRLDLTDVGTITATLTTTDPHALQCSVATDTMIIEAVQRAASVALDE